MFGLSDTTLGVTLSLLLHAGVAVAFLGPLGSGQGAGETVVTVTIDGVQATQRDDGELQLADPERASRADGDLSVPDQQKPSASSTTTKKPVPLKRLADSKSQPEPKKEIMEGGGGLLGSLYSRPSLVSMPKPLYPENARERGVEGKVGIHVVVSAQGSVDAAYVVRSSGFEALDSAALESAQKATFKPALRAGVPIAAEKTMLVSFSLTE